MTCTVGDRVPWATCTVGDVPWVTCTGTVGDMSLDLRYRGRQVPWATVAHGTCTRRPRYLGTVGDVPWATWGFTDGAGGHYLADLFHLGA